MSGIVCAIRGGPGSQPTIQTAIGLAKQAGQTLHFLYVVNLDFLAHTASSRVQAVVEEMNQMGEFILLTAQQTAAAQGVEARGIVRKGNVGEEIVSLCHELEASYLVLGRPEQRSESNAFNAELLAEFKARIENETGAQVMFAGEEPKS